MIQIQKYLVLTVFVTLFMCHCKAQNVTYNADGSVTFNGTAEQTLVYDDVRFKYLDLLRLNSGSNSGIIADVNSGGRVELEVYGGANRDKLIFAKTLFSSSTSFDGHSHDVQWEGIKVKSDNTKILASGVTYSVQDQTKCSAISDPNLFKASIVSANGNYLFENPYFNCLRENNFNQNQKVKVKVIAKNAKVKRIKFPGQTEELILASKNPQKQFSVTIFINGQNMGTATPTSTPVINGKVGDDIKFVFNNSYPDFKRVPVFEGIPATWIAQFGGETKYQCTQSIQPGEYKPWLGFDSQVHGSLLRRYPKGYKQKFPDFDRDSKGNIVSWTFTLQREMDANKTVYVPGYKWPKEKTTPVKQRNNQKEGLNMELLGAYNDPYFINYSGPAFILGSDPDEIFYLAGQDVDTYANPPLQGLLRKTDEVWKIVGYDESEDPINDVVTAYIKNRLAKEGKTDYSSWKYDSYEIQDVGTSPTAPEGTKTGNVKAPGICKITLGNTTVTFKLNVTNCLSNQKGFYAQIEGSRWPGWDERVSYKFWGFRSMTPAELRKYFLVCTSENSIGNVRKQIKYLKDLSATELDNIARNGYITNTFEMGGNGYNNLTVYKYNGTQTDSTIIAGKELLTIVLRFVTVPNGNQGIQLGEVSDGSHIYLEEFRDNKSDDPLYIRRYGRYMKKFTREYVVNQNSILTFYTLDSDPFTFYNTGTEWYLSSRYQAKRLPLTGAESQMTNVKYYLDPLNSDGSVKQLTTTPVGQGSLFTYTYRTPGDYQLRVTYRNSALNLYHRIKVVDYSSDRKGKIKYRELTPREKELLSAPTGYMIVEVVDILSTYKYVDGYRSQTPINRFGRYNDYYDAYVWKDQTGTVRRNPSWVITLINNYSEHDWLPFNWVRHFSDKPYPSDIDPSLFRNLEDVNSYIADLFDSTPEPWQLRLVWAPNTLVEGQRFRTNIKAIYCMSQYFDNDRGAFSGNPKAISTEEVFNRFIKDDEEDRKELINDLKFGRKLIVTFGNPPSGVYNISPKTGPEVPINGRLNGKAIHNTGLNTEKVKKKRVDIYPIPANDKLYINVSDLSLDKIKGVIFDISGMRLLEDYFLIDGKGIACVNTQKLSDGNYVIHVSSSDGSVNHTRKFVVKH